MGILHEEEEEEEEEEQEGIRGKLITKRDYEKNY